LKALFQYALGDFAVRQAARAFKKDDETILKYANRSMNFLNHWDSSVTSDGFQGFAQRRYQVSFFLKIVVGHLIVLERDLCL
jgi:putative alpha-1,2-mannosidase